MAISTTHTNGLNRLMSSDGIGPNDTVNYSYDPVGNLTNLTSVAGIVSYVLDDGDRLSSISAPADKFNFTYNTNNGFVSGVSAVTGGMIVAYGFDMMDRVTNIVWQDASNNVVRNFTYSFNVMGLITQKVTSVNGQLTTNIYGYDSLDRLISEASLCTSVTSVVNYAYDLAGNRTQMVNNGVTVNYTYGQGNQLVSWGTNGSQQFDAAGNVTNIQYEDGRQLTLTWDSRYRLTSVSTNGSLAEKYSYDALGRRISVSDGYTTNYLVYDGIHCIAEVDSTGGLKRAYTYGPGIDNILTMTVHTGATSVTYYYLKDHLGSVQAVADSSGTIVESYQYDAWGNVSAFDSLNQPITQSLIGNHFLWQGREYSWKTHLYYFRARWYDPVTSRWLSKDPIGISGGLNQYIFCADNSVNFIDPDGLKIRLLGNPSQQAEILAALQSFVFGKVSIGKGGYIEREPSDKDENYESMFDALIKSDNLYDISFGDADIYGGGKFEPRGFAEGGTITLSSDIRGRYNGWKGWRYVTDTRTTASVLAHELGHAISHVKKVVNADQTLRLMDTRREALERAAWKNAEKPYKRLDKAIP
jgi:RHS repeat-associated protein